MSDGKFIQVALNLPLRQVFTYLPCEKGECGIGMRVKVPFGRREMQGYVVDILSENPNPSFELKKISRIMETEPLFDSSCWQMALWMGDMYMCGWGEALHAILPGGKKEKELEDEPAADYGFSEGHTLTEAQEKAVLKVSEGNESLFYLHGVTGSGKTEVFFTLAERLMAQGRGIIYLVPEIALSHQMLDAVKKRFGSAVAVLHSALTPSMRLKQWKLIQRGEARFVIGARSAVFAPVRNLGLVIIDEEHENSYKSGSSPRYHARQVAMYRAKRENAKVLMGSATPSVEAYYLMKKGILTHLELPCRVSGGVMPEISIVDMNRQTSSISAVLKNEIYNAYSQGKQTILFLNRRGFFYNFSCQNCGFEMKCTHCSVPLTYHRSRNLLICHYCGYSVSPSRVCPGCGGLDVGYSGFGTEKTEEDIRNLFPYMKILRLDSDTATDKEKTGAVLSAFARKEADILLGTQMVAKGFNFPSVSLVGIILADTTLQMPDFRAAERTYSLLTQVSGRAGRFFEGGKVIIQTYRPDNYAITCAARNDEEGFYSRELSFRQGMGFPPFSRLFRFVFRSRDREKACNAAAEFAGRLKASSSGLFNVMGPAEAPIAVLSDNHRYQIIVNTSDFSCSHSILASLAGQFRTPFGVYMESDVDPVNLM